MNLEEQLHDLGNYLKQGTDLGPRVMAVVQRIERDSTASARGFRLRLLIQRFMPGLAAGLALAAMLLAVLTIWLMPVATPATVAFAEVQAAVQRVDTAVVVYDFLEVSWFNHTVLYRRDSDVVRTEWPSGIIELRDVKQGKQLTLDPKQKTSHSDTASRQMSFLNTSEKLESPRQLLDRLASVEAATVERLGEREFDGRKLVGFELPRNSILDGRMRGQIWVDPQSRLPVRFELLPADPANLARRYWRYVATFTFNRPLDAALFQFKSPEGYTATTEPADPPYLDRFPPPPKDAQLASPIIEPKVGLGPARFGMTLEQVIAGLGRPDDVAEHWEPSPDEQREIDAAFKQAAAEADEKGLTGRERALYINRSINRKPSKATARPPAGMTLDYHSRGITLIVSNEQGLTRIFCKGRGVGMKPFTGRTSTGIALGATVAQIEEAYGPADIKRDGGARGNPALYYRSLRLMFELRNNQLWQISLEKPPTARGE
jgi:hypothetical protein